MASNSKKRRRVLGASCILAALIIASSSFAWFTSKDEVTNRLTAQADYGVSIIEDFAPPKQWTPGQKVEKDEAVVNTGNVDAFVRQMVSGVLTVTVEVPTDTAPTGVAADNYIDLDAKKYGSLEAGSYLAWKPEASTQELGRKVSYAITNSDGDTNNDITDFTPDAEGLYVFRRAVTVNNAGEDVDYDYVGYYYKEGTYYKLHSLDVDTDAILANGNLSSEPAVTYAKKTTTVQNKVPMTYDAAADRLVVEFDPNADAATTSLNSATYSAYRAYLDALTGKTKWNQGGSGSAADENNKTGLTTYDAFDLDDTTANRDTVQTDLSNWSKERIDAGRTETQGAVTTATGTAWDELYTNAKTERNTVNKGIDAAAKLATLKSQIEAKIGAAKLTQATTSPYHYSSDATDTNYAPEIVTGTATPAGDQLKLTTPTAAKSTDANNATTMTVDNLDEARFADCGNTTTFGTQVTFTGPVNPYADGVTDTTIKDKWDAYVLQTKRMALVNKKIELVEAAIADATANGTTTNVGRDGIEATEYLKTLNKLKNAIQTALTKAKTEYETVQNNLITDLGTLNGYQDDVNAANAIYSNYPDDKSTVYNGGADDTSAEDTLEAQLKAVYGIALKDPAGTYYTADGKPYDTAAANKQTYSPTVTKDTIDGDLTSTSGVIGWKSGATLNSTQQGDVEAKPYYADKKVEFMQTYRDAQVNNLKARYDNASRNSTGVTDGDKIKLYVQLANQSDDGSARDMWQYIADATAANEYNFYYTGILETGETSNKLIDYVEFDSSVTQNAFIDMTFDLNVELDSAQAIYDGDKVKSEAAKGSIVGAVPTDDVYASKDETVTWKKDTGVRTQTTDKDNPDPKDKDVVPGAHTTSVNGESVTVTDISATPFDTNYIYSLEYNGKTYYGKTNTDGSAFYEADATTPTQVDTSKSVVLRVQ